jgi:hypothetical protein
MSEEPRPQDPGVVWRSQPREKLEMNLQHFLTRRTQELYSRTRSEIITSIAATVFFVAMIVWRFAGDLDRLLQLGFVLVIVWLILSLYWFRDRIGRRVPQRTKMVAATGVEYYRNELEYRRDHLKSAWLWQGPMFLAVIIFLAILVGKALPNMERLRNMLPFVLLLTIWTFMGFMLRRRHAKQIQQEIDELSSLSGPS